LDYARYGNQTYQTFTTRYFNLEGNNAQPDYILFGDLQGDLNIKSIKLDYVHPLKKHGKLEFGIKSSLVHADNNVQFFDKSDAVAIFDSVKSNHFIYNENINAAYANWSKEFKKVTVQLGLRAEQTVADGIQLVNGQSFDKNYLNFFPSAFFNYNASEAHVWGLNLSRRLDRPSYSQLNPFKFYLDPSTFKEGNPFLNPEYTLSTELSHTFMQRFTTSFSYSFTNDNIVNVIIPDSLYPRITIQTDKNIRRFDYYSLSLTLPFEYKKWWNSLNTITGFYSHYIGNLANTNLDDGLPTLSFNSNNNFTISPTWSAELNLVYQTQQQYGFMVVKPQGGLSAGIQKTLWQRKGTLKLSISDILWTNYPRANMVFRDYRERFIAQRETRVATLSFTYRFGKSTVPQARRRTSGAEDEKRRAGN
jgi:Outer membrane protein beta-barrel family